MASLLLECAIRAALIVAGTGLVLWVLRVRRAAARHAAWTAVVLTMLALPLWSLGGPKLSLRVLQPTSVPAGVQSVAAFAPAVLPSIPDGVVSEATSGSGAQPAGPSWPGVLVGVYLFGAFLLLVRLAVGTLYAHRLRRSAATENGRATSDRCAVPITIGWLAPALILPRGWQAWPRAKLSAVLTHEGEHARRRDPLVQWLALLNRALFWFHPLAWWLERRLATLAEESCDAVVLAAGHSPEAYSEYLLDMVRTVATRGERLQAIGMAMPGSGLKERMRLILNGASTAPLSRVRIVCTVVFCAASTALFAGATFAPRLPSFPGADATTAQHANDRTSRFDVVSVKPCDPKVPGKGGRSGPGVSPGRLTEDCATLTSLIQSAYIRFAEGRARSPWTVFDTPIEGGPNWIQHERFLIEGTTAGSTTQEMMRGPMLQAVLEDRFHLKVHREMRQGPVYELAVAASGSKLKAASEGVCVSEDWTAFPVHGYPDPFPAGQHRCSITESRVDGNGNPYAASSGNSVYTAAWDDQAISLDELAKEFLHLDRPVLNKTGISGLVSLHVTHTFDPTDPDDGMPAPPSSTLFNVRVAAAVLKEVGLELKPSTGAREFLVIDSVERPTPNDAPAITAVEPPPAQGVVNAPASPHSQPPSLVQSAATTPAFDVVSVKPCDPHAQGPGRGAWAGQASPGLFRMDCDSLEQLINLAYVAFANGRPNSPATQPVFDGTSGPDWIRSERFTVQASVSGTPSAPTMRGPMLQAVLEDRFKLKMHRETREVPVYELVVAKGGPKLTPFKPGTCVPFDLNVYPQPPLEAGQRRCENSTLRSPDGSNWVDTAEAVTFDAWVVDKSLLPDRVPIVNKTGLTGLVSFRIVYSGADPGEYASALRSQLGLDLRPGKAPREFLIVDHAERPSPNGPAAVQR